MPSQPPSGERVVFRGGLHPASFGGALTFAACVSAITLLIVRRNPLGPETILQLWLAAAAIILAGVALPLARWWTAELAVTDRRLIVRHGLVRGPRLDVPLHDVRDVLVDQGMWGRLLDYGNVGIVHADAVTQLPRVARPQALREAVVRYAASAARRG